MTLLHMDADLKDIDMVNEPWDCKPRKQRLLETNDIFVVSDTTFLSVRLI